MQNPYKILNIDPSSPEEVIRRQYATLKAKYSEERFLPGKIGNDAADKLTELNSAFASIESDFITKKNIANGDSTAPTYDFSFISKLIEDKKFNDAQTALDNITYHTAEWHYTQAMLFYRREWTLEAKTQLERALAQEPQNQKYITALERLRYVMGNPRTNPQTLGNPQNPNMPQQDMLGPCATCLCASVCLTCCCGCPMSGRQ